MIIPSRHISTRIVTLVLIVALRSTNDTVIFGSIHNVNSIRYCACSMTRGDQRSPAPNWVSHGCTKSTETITICYDVFSNLDDDFLRKRFHCLNI